MGAKKKQFQKHKLLTYIALTTAILVIPLGIWLNFSKKAPSPEASKPTLFVQSSSADGSVILSPRYPYGVRIDAVTIGSYTGYSERGPQIIPCAGAAIFKRVHIKGGKTGGNIQISSIQNNLSNFLISTRATYIDSDIQVREIEGIQCNNKLGVTILMALWDPSRQDWDLVQENHIVNTDPRSTIVPSSTPPATISINIPSPTLKLIEVSKFPTLPPKFISITPIKK